MGQTPDLELAAEVEEREGRFESLFEQASIPLFEEDFSGVMTRLAPLAASGELDEALLLADDRALARECAGLARIVAINAEARGFFSTADGSPGLDTKPGSPIDPNFSDRGWLVFARELLALVRGELPFEDELSIVLPGEEDRTIAIRVAVPPEARASLSRVFVSFLDVTRQKRAEAALKSSLRENEALIRELRHRTRNNMQMISSMLRFEEERAPDERGAAAFRSLNDRIEAMAMVHETLSSSGELSQVGLSSYASELVGLFLRNRGGEASKVTACVEAEDICLPIDAAVPFGLALGEMISNSLRHAFKYGKAGRLWLRLGLSGGILRLEVEDDGSGLPEGFDFRTDGKLGIQNVLLIVEGQLRGTVELESGSYGTKWKASIPLPGGVGRL
jgi:two-component sensor histidine kinase